MGNMNNSEESIYQGTSLKTETHRRLKGLAGLRGLSMNELIEQALDSWEREHPANRGDNQDVIETAGL